MTTEPPAPEPPDHPERSFLVEPDGGRRIDLPGWSMRVKVGAEDTVGAVTVLDGRMAPRTAGAIAHIHDGHDETFVVLEGRLRFRLEDTFLTARAGDTVYAGRRLAHGFGNPFDEEAHYLVVLTPGGYEGYFFEVEEHVARNGTAPDASQARALMAKYATEAAPFVSDEPREDLAR